MKIKLHKKLKPNPKLFYAGVILISVALYLIIFTDKVICKDCVLNEGQIQIKNDQFNSALRSKEIFFKYNNQSVDQNQVREETLKELKNQQRVENYAKNKNIKVTDSEVDKLYEDRIKLSGSEEELLKKVRDLYGFEKADYKKVLRQDILQEKVQQALGIPLTDWLSTQK